MTNYQSLGQTVQKGMKTMMQRNDGDVDVEESGIHQNTETLRIILVGKTGAGRSATGNTILGQKIFESRLGSQVVTQKCQMATGMWNGRRISVIDTPAICEPGTWTEEMFKEIGECYLLSSPGPHAVVLVTQIGRFTAQDEKAMRMVKKVFGIKVMSHLVMLFTRKEDLGQSLADYVTNTDNINLRRGIGECGRRFCAFNNRATGEEQKAQVAELMTMIQKMVEENEGSCYRNMLYFETDLYKARYINGDEESYQKYLKIVKFHIHQHTWELKEAESNCIIRAYLRTQKWVLSHKKICLFILIIVVFIAIIVVIVTFQRT